MNQGTTIKLVGCMKYMANTTDELSAMSNVKYSLVNVGYKICYFVAKYEDHKYEDSS